MPCGPSDPQMFLLWFNECRAPKTLEKIWFHWSCISVNHVAFVCMTCIAAQAATCVEWNWTRSGRMITTRTGDFQLQTHVWSRLHMSAINTTRMDMLVVAPMPKTPSALCHWDWKWIKVAENGRNMFNIAYPLCIRWFWMILVGSKLRLMRLERGSIGWHNAEVWYAFLGRKHPREAKGGALWILW
jgi:hypothetical protein